MKHLPHIVSLLMMLFSSIVTFAQTPFDAFSPETSRPILDGDSIAAWRAEHHSDTVFCAIVADLHNEQLLLVDITTSSVLAYAPFTDEMKNWISVDPLADKNIQSSPYMYCSGNPIMFFDPNGKDDEWVWDGETATRTHVDNGTDFVKVNGKDITEYDFSEPENQNFLSQIGVYYLGVLGITQDNISISEQQGKKNGEYGALASTSTKTMLINFTTVNGFLNPQAKHVGNILNAFVNEGVHKNGDFCELNAIEAQIRHYTWWDATDDFRQGVLGYALREFNENLSKGVRLKIPIIFQPYIYYNSQLNVYENSFEIMEIQCVGSPHF